MQSSQLSAEQRQRAEANRAAALAKLQAKGVAVAASQLAPASAATPAPASQAALLDALLAGVDVDTVTSSSERTPSATTTKASVFSPSQSQSQSQASSQSQPSVVHSSGGSSSGQTKREAEVAAASQAKKPRVLSEWFSPAPAPSEKPAARGGLVQSRLSFGSPPTQSSTPAVAPAPAPAPAPAMAPAIPVSRPASTPWAAPPPRPPVAAATSVAPRPAPPAAVAGVPRPTPRPTPPPAVAAAPRPAPPPPTVAAAPRPAPPPAAVAAAPRPTGPTAAPRATPRPPAAAPPKPAAGAPRPATPAPAPAPTPTDEQKEHKPRPVMHPLLDVDDNGMILIGRDKVKPRDADGKAVGEPGFDPTTLQIPQAVRNNMTDTMRQYWDVKCRHLDKIIVMKVGSFYEVYDVDAHTCHKVMGLVYKNEGNAKHACGGVPEVRLAEMEASLLRAGYRVGVIEQMTTGEGVAKGAVVTRKLCSILTPGTYVDHTDIDSSARNFSLMSIVATPTASGYQMGGAVLHAATGRLQVAEWTDDKPCNHLRSVVVAENVVEIVFDSDVPDAVAQKLMRWTQVPLRNTTRLACAAAPEAFRVVQPFFKSRASTADGSSSLDLLLAFGSGRGLQSLGGIAAYLRSVDLLDAVMSGCVLTVELPPAEGTGAPASQGDGNEWIMNAAASAVAASPTMELDACTVDHLELLANSVDGSTKGTLFSFLDRCTTPAGKRLLRAWMMRPLCDVEILTLRQAAVEELVKNPDQLDLLASAVSQIKTADLEVSLAALQRHVARMTKASHVMYDTTSVHRNTAKLLQRVVKAAVACEEMIATPAVAMVRDATSALLLSRLLSIGNGTLADSQMTGVFPDVSELLGEVKTYMNCKEVLGGDGDAMLLLPPSAEGHPAIRQAAAAVLQAEDRLRVYVQQQERTIGVSIALKRVGKYSPWSMVMEMAKPARPLPIPDDWTTESGTAKLMRYSSPQLAVLLEQLRVVSEASMAAQGTVLVTMANHICSVAAMLRKTAACIATLDCLASLAHVSSEPGMVMPVIVPTTTGPCLRLEDCWHPCIVAGGRAASSSGASIVPNTVLAGGVEPAALLVTGPNMGGKSTLLRQIALIQILAQMGCRVPAARATVGLVDRIFTRVGASDRLLAGQSTFFVELEETATILRHCTRKSLVIVDELGRGTSTFDGAALAHAVLAHLAHDVGCICLFSTHYHSLTTEFGQDPAVALYHMACHVDADQTVTFLYKFCRGIASSSFGINVARIAGLPKPLLDTATRVASLFEQQLQLGIIAHVLEELLHATDGGRVLTRPQLIQLQQYAAGLVRD